MKVIVPKQFEKDTEKELNKPLQLKLAILQNPGPYCPGFSIKKSYDKCFMSLNL